MNKRIPYQIYWLSCSVGLALLSAVVRLWQEETAFEGEYALPIPGADASLVLVCVTIMAWAILGILAAQQPMVTPPPTHVRGRRWDMSFYAKGDKLFLGLMTCAAVCALAAAPLLFSRGRSLWRAYQLALAMNTWKGGDNGVLSMCTAVLALLAFLGLLQIGRDGYRPGRRGKGGFWAALPACAGCGWLLDTYRSCAADPVLWDYVPLLLAVIAGMLMYIDWAGMACAAARPRRTLWLAGVTVVCTGVALAAQAPMGTTLLLISQCVAALAALWRMPINLQCPPVLGSQDRVTTLWPGPQEQSEGEQGETWAQDDAAPHTQIPTENKEENSHE